MPLLDLRPGVAAVAVVVALVGLACEEPPPIQELETAVDFRIGGEETEERAASDLVDDLGSAERRIWTALGPNMLTQEVADALVAAENRGVEVHVVADSQWKGENERFESIQESDIAVTFGDGELLYLPDPTLSPVLQSCERREQNETVLCNQFPVGEDDQPLCDGGRESRAMCRPDRFNLMSHRFALVDDRVAWNFATGLDEENGTALEWRTESEYVIEDFEREFRQLADHTPNDGVDDSVFATTLDQYNGPVKSTTDDRIDYHNDQGMMEIRFNPQERLMKHVIDTVYDARAAIWVASPSIRNPFLLDALGYKSNRGFDVRIIVGDETQPPGDARDKLQELGADFASNGAEIPSMVVTDAGDSNGAGRWPRMGLVLSHPMWRAQPFDVLPPNKDLPRGNRADRVEVFPSDHFVDGNMWMLREASGNKGGTKPIDKMAEVYRTLEASVE